MERQVCNTDWKSQSDGRGLSVQPNHMSSTLQKIYLKKKKTTTTHWHLKFSFIRLARAEGVITEPVWAAALELQPPIDLNVGYSAGVAPLIKDQRATYNFLCAFIALCVLCSCDNTSTRSNKRAFRSEIPTVSHTQCLPRTRAKVSRLQTASCGIINLISTHYYSLHSTLLLAGASMIR